MDSNFQLIAHKQNKKILHKKIILLMNSSKNLDIIILKLAKQWKYLDANGEKLLQMKLKMN